MLATFQSLGPGRKHQPGSW